MPQASPVEMSGTISRDGLQTSLPRLDNRQCRLHDHHRRHLLTEETSLMFRRPMTGIDAPEVSDEEEDSSDHQRYPRCQPRSAREPSRGQRVQRPGTREDVPKPATKREEKIWGRTSATSHDPDRQLELDLDV